MSRLIILAAERIRLLVSFVEFCGSLSVWGGEESLASGCSGGMVTSASCLVATAIVSAWATTFEQALLSPDLTALLLDDLFDAGLVGWLISTFGFNSLFSIFFEC